jgi:hypothetical protein
LAVRLVGLIAIFDAATRFSRSGSRCSIVAGVLATWAAGAEPGLQLPFWRQSCGRNLPRLTRIPLAVLLLGWGLLFSTLFVCAGPARLRRALDSADQRFETVLEGLDAAVYVNDAASGAMLYANRRFRDYFPSAMMPVNAALFERRFHALPPDPHGRSKSTAESSHLRAELLERATGRWFLVHASTVGWVDGRDVSLKVSGRHHVGQARGRIESRQQAERLQMSARLLTIGEIASGLAHELNQPLTAIASYNHACLKLLRSQHRSANSPVTWKNVVRRRCAPAASSTGCADARKREPRAAERHQCHHCSWPSCSRSKPTSTAPRSRSI